MKERRVSFESKMTEEEAQENLNKGIKLKPSRSRQMDTEIKGNFQEKVDETSKRLDGHLKEAYELGKEFTNLMGDTRIAENIGPYDRSFENEITRKLVNYAIMVNTDPQENEGMGSVSLITLLLKYSFKMRDNLNEAKYKNHLLEKRVAQLEKTVISLEKTVLSSRVKDTNEA